MSTHSRSSGWFSAGGGNAAGIAASVLFDVDPGVYLVCTAPGKARVDLVNRGARTDAGMPAFFTKATECDSRTGEVCMENRCTTGTVPRAR